MTQVLSMEAALVAAMARGDPSAFATLFDLHADLLLSVAQRVLGDPRDAEDVVHDAMIEAWAQAATFEPARGSVRAWLVVRVRSRALDRQRSLRRRREAAAVGGLEESVADLRGEDPTLVLDRRRVALALDGLRPEWRDVLLLAHWEGLSASQIAAHLGLPVGTVKSRTAAALRALRAAVGVAP